MKSKVWLQVWLGWLPLLQRGANGPFTDVTLFRSFHSNKKKHHRLIYHAEISKYAKFHKNLLQTHENMGPQTCRFLQRNLCHGATLAPLVTY